MYFCWHRARASNGYFQHFALLRLQQNSDLRKCLNLTGPRGLSLHARTYRAAFAAKLATLQLGAAVAAKFFLGCLYRCQI